MKKIILISFITLTLGACANARDTRMADGALIGGASGAILGGVATGTTGGAVVGGVLGAGVGAVVADATRPYHHRNHCFYNSDTGQRVCHYR